MRAALDEATRERLQAETAKPAIEPGAPAAKAETAKPAAKTAEPKPNPIRVLQRHFETAYDLVHSQGKAYAVPCAEWIPTTVDPDPPGVAVPFGPELRRRIVRVATHAAGMPPISRATADTVMLHLEAAAFEGPETPLALRFHHDHARRRVCIDLGHSAGGVVVITAEGWSVETEAEGVVFKRSHATRPLPEPVHGGRLADLAELLALDPGGPAFKALVGWVVGLPFAASVRPGALLVGPYGSGKSTRLRLATSVLEPSGADALGSAFGRNFGDDQVRSLHRAVPLWDNLTAVSGSVSDELCCLVTGTARETRALYSDNDLNAVPIARPLGLTAVGVPAGLRPDALDRLIVVDVPPVAHRRGDAELQAAFDAAHPALLGAVCTAVSCVLARLDRAPEDSGHRMAAHTQILAALDQAVEAGELDGPGGLLATYAELSRTVKQRTAAEDSFGAALLELLNARGQQWSGKASELLADAGWHTAWAGREPGWPTSARRVPEVLNHLRDGLEACGVRWTTTTVRGSTRYTFTAADPPASAAGSLEPAGGAS